MLGITGKLSVVRFDDEKFTETLDKEMRIILRGAVKEYVRTLIHAIRRAPHTMGDTFPIQTGEAKASLRPIARFARVALPIRPAPKRPDHTSRGESKGHFEFTSEDYQYRFTWSTDVEHFLINEFNHIARVRSSTPWHATVAARNAAQAYIKQEVRKRIKKFKIKTFLVTKATGR